MATEALKSGNITNRDSTPAVKINAAIAGGVMHGAAGTVEVTTDSDAGSTYRMFSIPSNARVHKLNVYTDAALTNFAADIGIYKSTADGGTVVDADHFGSAVDLATSAENGTDVTHESGVNNIDDVEKPLWQALGLTSDPNLIYDVVLTSTTASGAAGTLSLKGSWTV